MLGKPMARSKEHGRVTFAHETITSVLLALLAALLWIASSSAMAGGLIPSQSLDNQSTALTQKWVAVRSVGETITVTTLNDVSDFSGFQQVSDLPGPDGRVSFREAVTAANNSRVRPSALPFRLPIFVWTDWLCQDGRVPFSTQLQHDVDFTTQTTNEYTNPTGLG